MESGCAERVRELRDQSCRPTRPPSRRRSCAALHGLTSARNRALPCPCVATGRRSPTAPSRAAASSTFLLQEMNREVNTDGPRRPTGLRVSELIIAAKAEPRRCASRSRMSSKMDQYSLAMTDQDCRNSFVSIASRRARPAAARRLHASASTVGRSQRRPLSPSRKSKSRRGRKWSREQRRRNPSESDKLPDR